MKLKDLLNNLDDNIYINIECSNNEKWVRSVRGDKSFYIRRHKNLLDKEINKIDTEKYKIILDK